MNNLLLCLCLFLLFTTSSVASELGDGGTFCDPNDPCYCDGDGDIDGDDLIEVVTRFGTHYEGVPYIGDYDCDQDVDGDDLIFVQTNFGLTSPDNIFLFGDADGDGDVDGDDVIAVQTNFGSVSPPPGDADNDGDVDGDDLVAALSNIGNHIPIFHTPFFTKALAVPEPTSAGLILAFLLITYAIPSHKQ